MKKKIVFLTYLSFAAMTIGMVHDSLTVNAADTNGSSNVDNSGTLKITNYAYNNGYVRTKDKIIIPEGKSMVIQWEVLEDTVSAGYVAFTRTPDTFNSAWTSSIQARSSDNYIFTANNETGYNPANIQTPWADMNHLVNNSLIRHVFNADGSAKLYGTSSLNESNLALYYYFTAGQILNVGSGYVGFAGNDFTGSYEIDNYKVGYCDNDSSTDNITWVFEDNFATADNWVVETGSDKTSIGVTTIVDNPTTNSKSILSTDFETALSDDWYLTSNPAGSVTVENGKLEFQQANDGSYFGPKNKYVNFELKFDIVMQQLDEDDEGNITKASTWAGISFGRNSLNASYGANKLIYINNGVIDDLNITNGVRNWLSSSDDMFHSSNFGKSFTVRVNANGKTVKVYLTNNGLENPTEKLVATYTDVETEGYVALCCTNGGDFTIDNFSIRDLDYNSAPVLTDSSITHDVTAGNTVTGSVSATDAENDTLTYILEEDNTSEYGTLTFNEDGTYTFVANANATTGTASFTYKASDTKNTSEVGTVTFNVTSQTTPSLENVNVWMNLAYKYTVTTDEETTTYSNVEFRLQLGVDSTIATKASEFSASEYGIKVTCGDRTETYAYTENVTRLDATNNIYYEIVSLGDVINNIDRASDEFTIQAYMVVDGTTYLSTATKTYSVKTMVFEYHEDANTTSKVAGLYAFFEAQGLYA